MFTFDVTANANDIFSDNVSFSICSACANGIDGKILHSFSSNTLACNLEISR